jgi:O-antigen ligase
VETSPKNKISNKKLNLAFLCGIPAVSLIFDVNINDPFNVPKLIVLILISSLLLVNILFGQAQFPFRKKSIQFKVTLFVAVFGMIQFILIFSSPNLIVALFGETQRRNGFFAYLALCVIFVYAMREINFENYSKYIGMLVYTGLLISGYGLIQASGRDWVNWDNPYNNAITTFGNPNFTSAFLALICVCCILILLTKQFKAHLNILAILLIPTALYIIWSSDSRQGIYALVVGVVFYFLVLAFITNLKYRYVLSVFVFSGLTLSIVGMLQMGPLSAVLYKPSVSVRGYYWKAALEMFLSNPLTGVGLDSYGYYFREFKDVGYVRNYGVEITSNNAHNTFLQFFATGGLFLGLTYLSLVILILVLGLYAIKKSTNFTHQKILLVFLSVYITFQAQSLISIDSLGLSVWSWTIGGSIVGLSSFMLSQNTNTSSTAMSTKNIKKFESLFLLKPIFQFVFIAPAVLISVLVYRPESEMFILRGLINPDVAQNKVEMLPYSTKIISNKFADPFLKLKSMLFMADMGYEKEAFELLKDLSRNNPDWFEPLWAKAFFENKNRMTESELSTRMRIQSIDKFNTKNYLQIMKIYKEYGNEEKLELYRDLIVAIAPNSLDRQEAEEILLSQ